MIDLPGDCALVAVCAFRQLEKHNVPCRLLAVTHTKPVGRHIVLVFEFDGNLRIYDREGSVSLSRRVSFASSPTKIAKEWKANPRCTFDCPVIRGEWY